MEQGEKVRENRLRRMATRQGLRLTKTRRFDPLAIDYGTYHLVPAKGKPFGPFSIDEVEKRLTTSRFHATPLPIGSTLPRSNSVVDDAADRPPWEAEAMLTDAEIAFLRARLDEDEVRAQAALEEWDDEGARYEWEDLPDASFAHARCHGPARVLREVAVWRRLLLEYQTAGLDAVYGGTERETGFRLALSAALKAKIATYDGNPVTGEPFPSAPG